LTVGSCLFLSWQARALQGIDSLDFFCYTTEMLTLSNPQVHVTNAAFAQARLRSAYPYLRNAA
jgi:hypothetical protein